jgi:tetratricopeptide (TPR) repeat protein
MFVMIAGLGRGQIQSDSVTSPLSGGGLSPLTPPSTYENTLTPSRREAPGYDRNRMITGEVPGGPHFRGPVPYTSISSGSGSKVMVFSPVDSFIRRSGGQSYIERDATTTRPFQAPPGAVTSMHRYGLSPLTGPSAILPETSGRRESDAFRSPLSPSASGIYRPRSTLSMSAAELQRLSGIDAMQESMRLPIDTLLERSITVEPPGTLSQEAVLRPRRQPEVRQSLASPAPAPSIPLEPDVPLSEEVQELKALLEQDFEALDMARGRKPAETMSEERKPLPAAEQEQPAEPVAVAGVEVEPAVVEPAVVEAPPLEPLGPVEQRKVRGILGEHKTFESLAAAKVKEFAAAGDALMKEGKYYKAIDAYALAAVWNGRDPRVNLHRAVAHFAAGEFISASLFLERAVLLEPSCAGGKIDLAAMLPSRDVIDNRLIEGANWQKRTGSGEIAMLLAWVHQQEGRTSRAAEYIKLAQQQIPANPAAAAIAKALTGQ